MWDSIKNDSLLRAITTIILGVLGFGFAFNIMLGSNSRGMMGNGEGMMGGGYSLDGTLAYILTMLFNLTLLAVVVLGAIEIFRVISRALDKEGSVERMETGTRNDGLLKGLAVITLIILAFALVLPLLGGTMGYGSGYSNGMMQSGFNSLNVNSILGGLIKVLLFVSVVGLIIGLGMYITQNYSKIITSTRKIVPARFSELASTVCTSCGEQSQVDFKFCPRCGNDLKEECASCKTELKSEWKCCPNCGAEKQGKKDVVPLAEVKSET